MLSPSPVQHPFATDQLHSRAFDQMPKSLEASYASLPVHWALEASVPFRVCRNQLALVLRYGCKSR